MTELDEKTKQLLQQTYGGARPSDDFNKFSQNMEKLLAAFEMHLRGEKVMTKSDGTDVVVRMHDIYPEYIPPVNEIGRDKIMNGLRNIMNHNTYLSGVDEEESFNSYMADISGFSMDLLRNHEEFDLEFNSYMEIMNTVSHMVFMALKKAETDKENIYKATSTTYQIAPPSEKKGILGGLF